MNHRGIISTSLDAPHRGLLDYNKYSYARACTVARIGILFVSEWVVSYTRNSWRQRYSAIISDMATSRCSTPMFRGWLRSFLPLSHPVVPLSFSTCVARRREGGRQGLWINTRATADPASQPASQPARFSRHPLVPGAPFRHHLLATTTTFVPFCSPSGRWYRLFCRFRSSPLGERIDHPLLPPLFLLLSYFGVAYCARDGSQDRSSDVRLRLYVINFPPRIDRPIVEFRRDTRKTMETPRSSGERSFKSVRTRNREDTRARELYFARLRKRLRMEI